MKPASLVLLLAALLLSTSPACQARMLRPSPFTSTKDVWIARFERFVLGSRTLQAAEGQLGEPAVVNVGTTNPPRPPVDLTEGGSEAPQVTMPDVTLDDLQASPSPSTSPEPEADTPASPSPSPEPEPELVAQALGVPDEEDSTPAADTEDTSAPAVTWEDAPACPSDADATNSQLDDSQRRWGWDKVNGRSCKFVDTKDTAADGNDGFGASEAAPEPAATAAATAADWAAAPACAGWPDDKAVADNSGRLWSTLEDGTSCAFKDSKGAPLVPWDKAPICAVVKARDIVKDDNGNEWAWDTQNDRSCAVHRA